MNVLSINRHNEFKYYYDKKVLDKYKKFILRVYREDVPKEFRKVKPEDIEVLYYFTTGYEPVSYACWDNIEEKIYFNLVTIKEMHKAKIYGKKTTDKKFREHIKYLLIHENCHALGMTHEDIEDGIANKKIPIKF
jgi:hypothetical protein